MFQFFAHNIQIWACRLMGLKHAKLGDSTKLVPLSTSASSGPSIAVIMIMATII